MAFAPHAQPISVVLWWRPGLLAVIWPLPYCGVRSSSPIYVLVADCPYHSSSLVVTEMLCLRSRFVLDRIVLGQDARWGQTAPCQVRTDWIGLGHGIKVRCIWMLNIIRSSILSRYFWLWHSINILWHCQICNLWNKAINAASSTSVNQSIACSWFIIWSMPSIII